MCGYNWTRPVARPKSLRAACLLATGIGHSALDKDGALCLRRVPDPDPLTLLHSGPAAAPADTHDGARVSNESERSLAKSWLGAATLSPGFRPMCQKEKKSY